MARKGRVEITVGTLRKLEENLTDALGVIRNLLLREEGNNPTPVSTGVAVVQNKTKEKIQNKLNRRNTLFYTVDLDKRKKHA